MQKNKLASTKAGSHRVAMKKTLVRNFEVPLGQTEKNPNVKVHLIEVNRNEIGGNSKKETRRKSAAPSIPNGHHKDSKEATNGYKSLHTPSFNSVNQLASNMDDLSINSKIRIENLTPASKKAVNQEVTKKLNFPYDKAIYTNLVPIDLDGSSCASTHLNSSRNRKVIRDKYLKSDKKKDPVPELKDFLSPVKRIEINVPIYVREIEIKTKPYDPFAKVHEIVTNHPSHKISLNSEQLYK